MLGDINSTLKVSFLKDLFLKGCFLKSCWLTVLSLTLCCSLNAAALDRSEPKLSQPNIIYILADDMGYSDMSWQGSTIQTPNLDRLADKGMVLQRNYAQPQCSPTRVSFLTGNYPYRYGLHEHIVLHSSQTGIPAQEKTIAQKMKEGGYKTSIIGKWHVGGNKQSYLPHNMGFDHSFIAISGNIDYWNYTNGGRNDLIRNGKKVYAPSKFGKESSGNNYSTFMWSEEAIEVIDSHDQKQPLFMFLSFNAPHSPFQAPKALMDKYSPDEIENFWSGPDADKGRTAHTRHYYMAMMDAMDKAIGDLVEAVKNNGMAENTLIVFMSDNGGIPQADNRPLRSYKGDSFEGGIRVPGIAYWPGTIKAGSKTSELIHVSDWYSTFADLAGMSIKEEGLDGVSARAILEGGKGQRKAIPIISAARHALVTADHSLVGTGENYQRLINQDLASFRLYDIKQDQSQKQPTRARPELEKKMEAQLAEHFKKVNRGTFNWDIKYAKHRGEKKQPHTFDYVINDLPQLTVSGTGAGAGSDTTVTVSPVSDKLVYNLQGSTDGEIWIDLAEYVAKENAKSYVFDGITTNKAFKEFKVLTSDHFGLPLRDGFSFGTDNNSGNNNDYNNGYKKGPLYTETGSGKLLTSLPRIDGFLPISDVSGAEQVMVVADSLQYQNWPTEGGALQLESKNKPYPPSLTRYFIEPHSQGKLYASMLVQFDGFESECIGEINFLVQNGWEGATEKQLSVSFQNDGITLNQADPIEQNLDSWLGEHHKKTVLLLLEFDLKTIGQDVLKVYINPNTNVKGKENLIPVATRKGEFTFDRLQFAMTGRAGGKMTVDEVHIGRNIDDVLY